MASIKEYLDQIRSAIYGEEVRGSIVNAITAMNNESSQAKNEATTAEEQARISAEAAKVSETKATQAQSHVSKIDNMTVSASKLGSGETPTVAISDDGTKKHLSFGIPKGDTGRTPNISMTVSTGSAGSDVTVSKSGTAENPSFALTIPRGNTGVQGPIGNTPNISVKVNTGTAGSNASVSKSGTAENPVLTFTIPRGNTGAMPLISAKAVTGEAGTNVNVAVSGTEENPVLTFTIPRGNKGDKGDPGPMPKLKIGTVTTGLPGTSASATLTGTTAEPVLNLTIPEGQRGVTEGVPLTNAPAAPLGETASPGTSNEVPRADHVHPVGNLLKNNENRMSLSGLNKGKGDTSERVFLNIKGWTNSDLVLDMEKYKALSFYKNNTLELWDSETNTKTTFYTTTNKPTPNEIGAVSFSAQTLTDAQKAQARSNIGAGTLSVAPVTSVNGQTGDVVIEQPESGPALSNALPRSLGLNANSGTSAEASRADHVHPTGNLLQYNENRMSLSGLNKGKGDTSECVFLTIKGWTNSNLVLDTEKYKRFSFYKNNTLELLDSETDTVTKFYTTTNKPTPNEIGAVSFSAQTLTDAQKAQARSNIGAGASAFSGSYNDLTNKPTIPTKVSQLQNDSGYLTSAPVTSVNGSTGNVTIDRIVGGEVIITAGSSGIHVNDQYGGSIGYIYVNSNGLITGYDQAGGGNHSVYCDINPPPYPVTSVNGQTGAVTIASSVTSVNGQTGDVVINAPVLSDAVPESLSTNGYAGSSNEVSRANHSHPYPTATTLGVVSYKFSLPLTDEEKQRARTNIGAAADGESIRMEVLYEQLATATIGSTVLNLSNTAYGAKYLMLWLNSTSSPCVIAAPTESNYTITHTLDMSDGTESNTLQYFNFTVEIKGATLKFTRASRIRFSYMANKWTYSAESEVNFYKLVAVR